MNKESAYICTYHLLLILYYFYEFPISSFPRVKAYFLDFYFIAFSLHNNFLQEKLTMWLCCPSFMNAPSFTHTNEIFVNGHVLNDDDK